MILRAPARPVQPLHGCMHVWLIISQFTTLCFDHMFLILKKCFAYTIYRAGGMGDTYKYCSLQVLVFLGIGSLLSRYAFHIPVPSQPLYSLNFIYCISFFSTRAQTRNTNLTSRRHTPLQNPSQVLWLRSGDLLYRILTIHS